MRKNDLLSIIAILTMVFVLLSCGNVDVDTSIKVYDYNERYIGEFLGFNDNKAGIEAAEVLTQNGYIISFEYEYNLGIDPTNDTPLIDFLITTGMYWEFSQTDNVRYIEYSEYGNVLEDNLNYLYYEPESDPPRFWVHDGNPWSTVTLAGFINWNGNIWEAEDEDDKDELEAYKLLEVSMAAIGIPPIIDFPLSIR